MVQLPGAWETRHGSGIFSASTGGLFAPSENHVRCPLLRQRKQASSGLSLFFNLSFGEGCVIRVQEGHKAT